MKLGKLKDVLYSARGDIQMAVLYERKYNNDADSGSIDYLVEEYPNVEVERIAADGHNLIIITKEV